MLATTTTTPAIAFNRLLRAAGLEPITQRQIDPRYFTDSRRPLDSSTAFLYLFGSRQAAALAVELVRGLRDDMGATGIVDFDQFATIMHVSFTGYQD